MKGKVHNSNFSWLKMTPDFDSTQLSVQELLGVSELAHVQCSPPPPLLSCLCRERLNSFDSTVKLLIRGLSVCWQPFNTAPQVQASANQARVGQLHSGVWVQMRHEYGAGKRIIWKAIHHLFKEDSFHRPFACSQAYPTILCCMPLSNRQTGNILKGWWMHSSHINLIQL